MVSPPGRSVLHLPTCWYCGCVSATGDHVDCEMFFLWKTEQTNRFYAALRALPDEMRAELLTAYRESRLSFQMLGVLGRAKSVLQCKHMPLALREIEVLIDLVNAFGDDDPSPPEAC